MRITATREGSGWNVYPESGRFQGKLIGKADGLSLRAVDLHSDGVVSGEVTAVWGLEVYDPMIFNDPLTVRGLRIGFGFDMREQDPLDQDARGFTLSESGFRVTGASSMWMLGDEMQAYSPHQVRSN